MGTFNGNTKGGAFAASARSSRKHPGAGLQILFSLLLAGDLFLLYTMIMQVTHEHDMAFEASPAVNWILLAVFAVAAVALIYLVIRSRAWKRTLCILLIFTVLYLTAVFSNVPLIKEYREIWITTAMSTMRHRGLATYYFPASVVDARMDQLKEAMNAQVGENTLETFSPDPLVSDDLIHEMETATGWVAPDVQVEEMSPEQKNFYLLFYELDVDSTESYFRDHPDVLSNGYEHILINETSLNGNGTTIRTKLGEKVLAIDVDNQILILEVDCAGSRGVLAIGKLPSRLRLCSAASLPYHGDTVGVISKKNGGVLAMTGSSFIDVNAAGEVGKGNGGMVCGYAMCGGVEYKGDPLPWGYKRLELHEDNRFYIKDTFNAVGSGTTDAMEFSPAMVVNGKKQDVGYWTDKNPRACIGQSARGEILMLGVEGRGVGGSWGCNVGVCSDMLLKHDCVTAMNCDGGTTAMICYRNEPIMRCSNTAIPNGRRLPNSWVYGGE